MDYKEFHFVGSHDRTALRNALLPRLKEWSLDWFNDELITETQIEGETGAEIETRSDWLILGQAPDNWIAWNVSHDLSASFTSLLFAGYFGQSNNLTPLMEKVFRECLSEFTAHCFSAAQINVEPNQVWNEETLLLGYGSGAVALTLAGSLSKHHIILGGGVVRGIAFPLREKVSTNDALTPRHLVLGNLITPIEARLGEVELSLAEITGMKIGDILALPVHHGDTLNITTPRSKHLFKAHLGLRAENKALHVHSI